MALDATGNIYIGGYFLNFNGTERRRVAKLGPTGALDTAFDPGIGANDLVFAIAPPTGTAGVVVGGWLTAYNGVPVDHIARLDATTAAIDSGFNHTPGFNSTVRTLVLQPGGNYLVGEF